MKLYELTQGFNKIFELIDDEDFDLDTLEIALQSVESDVGGKIENIARMIRNWEAQAKAMEAEEKRIGDTRKAIENRVIRMKDYVLDSLTVMGKDKIPTAIGNVCRQKNPQSIDVFDLKIVPSDYVITPPVESRADKKAILLHYKTTGEIVPGTRLAPQSYHLRIR